jgi:hypothetical protein
MNIEGELVSVYNETPTLSMHPASTNIPAKRPKRFITVERVGGVKEKHRDLPLVAIQVWDESRWAASEKALEVAEVTRALALTHPRIARVEISSIYNNPDPATEHARFQINAQLTTT